MPGIVIAVIAAYAVAFLVIAVEAVMCARRARDGHVNRRAEIEEDIRAWHDDPPVPGQFA